MQFDLVRRGDLTDPLSVTLSVTESGAFLSGAPPARWFSTGAATAVLRMGRRTMIGTKRTARWRASSPRAKNMPSKDPEELWSR